MNGAAVFFYALTKNQIVRIISIASYLTKKNWEKKIICCSRQKCSLGHIFFSTQIKFKFGTSWIKNKAELCTTDHCFFERDRGGRIEMQPCNSW